MVSKKVLSVFTQLNDESEAKKPSLCIRLWNYLNHLNPNDSAEEADEENTENSVPRDVEYILRRLIQGLGSGRAFIRKNYFATLTSLLSEWTFSHSQISLNYFKSLVDKYLCKSESKGEEGEILAGRILAYGVAFRSKLFLKADIELQHEVLTEMLTKSKERSYLPLLAYTFIIDLMKRDVDEDTFVKVVWPILKSHILVDWSNQSFETLCCLIEIQALFPNVLKKKLILPIFKAKSVVHIDSLEIIQKMLTNITWEPSLEHPVYDTFCSYVCREDSSLSKKFWEYVENVLKSSPNKLQQLAVLKIFCSMVKNSDILEIPSLLTSYFLDYLINTCRSTSYKKDILSVTSREALQFLISRVITSNSEKVISDILCQILFDSGHLLVDKITGIRVVSPCVSKLNGQYLKVVAKRCKSVVLLQEKNKDKEHSQHRWNFRERCYATQLLARLISHPESQDMDWKIKYLKIMMKSAIFSSVAGKTPQISNELAITVKNSFFTALSHQLSHLENHRMVLLSLVFYIDNVLTTKEHQLRNPLSDEMMSCWKHTMQIIQKIDLKIDTTGKQKTVMYVFQTLFLQMALHLFVDPTVAQDVLTELNRCYKKEKSTLEPKKLEQSEASENDKAEPQWIEIVVELLLSLLSRDTYSLRQLISRIFPHLCPYLTAQAAFQILQVFDPTSNNNILTDENESEEESSDNDDSDEENKNEDGKNSMDVEEPEEESDSEVEEEEEVEESAIEKTRQAVRDALGVAGSVTDTESIDLDDIDEEEGRKLDVALSEAFRIAKKPPSSKNKKQSPSEKALTNFRTRVLDLVDIYLDNNPSFSLVLDTIPALFALLEFCIKDNHQKPLETRVRSTLKKIASLKKCSNVDDVDEEILASILTALMDKGIRTTPVFLNLCHEMSECCTLLLKMAIQVCGNSENSSSLEIYNIFTTSVDNFFLKRDCLLPMSLFQNILTKTNWIYSTKLCCRILSLSFNPNVRGFRRNQGLILLNCFYKNNRLLATLKENNDPNFTELEDEIVKNAIVVFTELKGKSELNLKPSFLSELFMLLYSIKVNKFSAGSHKWNKLTNVLKAYSSNGSSVPNVCRRFMQRLFSVLQIESQDKPSISRKRKKSDSDKESEVQENGFAVPVQNDISDEEVSSGIVNNDSESVSSSKNVIKKKKSKRKTKEHFESKKLRSELANDVELVKFSSAKILKT